MHPKYFAEGLEMISQVFGDTPTKGPRLGRIKSLCDGRVSGEGFVEICEALCDNSRYAPLPGDFDKGVIEWRKNFHRINGRSYFDDDNGDVIEAQFTVIDCDKCNDIGFVRITHRNPSDFESLMRCVCTKGVSHVTAIPEWDSGLSGGFNHGPCPIDWFKPDIKETDTDETIHTKVWDRVSFFQNKKHQAEKHWSNLGFKKGKGA